MSILSDNVIEIFKKFYPDIPTDNLEKELLIDMLEDIYQEVEETTNDDKSDLCDLDNDLNDLNDSDDLNDLIEENFIKANNLIPEMIVPTELIYIKGKLNGIPVNILFDSGAMSSTTFKSITDKADIDYLIDKDSRSYIVGVNNISMSYGKIWYIDLELEIETDKYISIPISLCVNDDTSLNKKIKSIQSKPESDQEKKHNKKVDILLGINFMKTYKVKIDFNKRTIMLNDSIIIPYN